MQSGLQGIIVKFVRLATKLIRPDALPYFTEVHIIPEAAEESLKIKSTTIPEHSKTTSNTL